MMITMGVIYQGEKADKQVSDMQGDRLLNDMAH